MILQCKKCVHFERCEWLLSRKGSENYCDWEPSHFKLKKVDEIENFLDTNTFICTVFNARMSAKQCIYQCARSKQKISEYIVDYFSAEDLEVPTKYNECLHCFRFRQPKASTIKRLGDRAKRFRNTPNGTACMRVVAYLEARKNPEAKEEQ